jgi:hypothetical protein
MLELVVFDVLKSAVIRRQWKRRLLAAPVLFLFVAPVPLLLVFPDFPNLLGEGRYHTSRIPPPSHPIPMNRDMHSGEDLSLRSAERERVLAEWAARPLPPWPKDAKVDGPRIALAKLACHRDIAEVNRYLETATVWSGSGSEWFLHKGDYDFTEATLTEILYLFGDQPELLYPATTRHLLDTLLVEEGGAPHPAVPRTFGLILDTENHHLMREGSRYLKNQWIAKRGDPGAKGNPIYDNRANGLEEWLIAYLDEMKEQGIYEFNSNPYLGYTAQALLNLEAFADSPEVATRARYLLDTMNLQYALGSLCFRRCVPFRRQVERANWTGLEDDHHTRLMKVWTDSETSGKRDSAALIAAAMPYRLPESLRAWTLDKQGEYFVRFGRGENASPEIHSGGPGYLISAGGASRGWRSRIVARPTVLLLDDKAADYRECFHLPGLGSWQDWNNTGVCSRFACSNAPAVIPSSYSPAAEGRWKVFQPQPGLLIAVFNQDFLGLLAVFSNSTLEPEGLLQALEKANPSEEALQTVFHWPEGGAIEYDVNAPIGFWPICAINGAPVQREYDQWPLWEGDLPEISFARGPSQPGF